MVRHIELEYEFRFPLIRDHCVSTEQASCRSDLACKSYTPSCMSQRPAAATCRLVCLGLKAFNMVDHQLLLSKLRFCDKSAKLFDSYLSDRKQLLSLAGKNSDYANVPHGVPQGSILAPLQFDLFINDHPLHTNASGVNIDLYADDTTITASAEIDACSKL